MRSLAFASVLLVACATGEHEPPRSSDTHAVVSNVLASLGPSASACESAISRLDDGDTLEECESRVEAAVSACKTDLLAWLPPKIDQNGIKYVLGELVVTRSLAATGSTAQQLAASRRERYERWLEDPSQWPSKARD